MDFSSVFGSERRLGTFVRRRRWIRYRHFIALDRWVLIPVTEEVTLSAQWRRSLSAAAKREAQDDDFSATTFVPVEAFASEGHGGLPLDPSEEEDEAEQLAEMQRAAAAQWEKQRSSGLSDLEPIVDIAVGGESLPHQEDGFLAVWVVTLAGKVR